MRRAVLLLIVVLLAGCTSGGKTTSSSSKRPGAAEPSNAPSSASPAGTLRTVGDKAEGIVRDPTTNTVAVAVRNPPRLLLLDDVTLQLRKSVPLPGVVRHLQLAGPGGPVLVPCESANALAVVTLPDGALTKIGVGKAPHDATATDDGTFVVGDEFGPSLSVVRNGTLTSTITGQGIEQPGGVVGFGSDVALVDVHAFTVSTFDPASGKRIAVVPAGKGPTHGVLVKDNLLAVADTRGGALLTFSLNPLKALASVPLPGGPYGIAADPQRGWVWLTLTARNQVVGYDLSGSTPREVGRYPTVAQPNTVAVAPGSGTLWITGTRDGQVQRIPR